MSILIGHYHLMHNILDIFVGLFDCAIHFRSIWRKVVMLDLELIAKFDNHNIVEVSPIFSDDPFGDTITTDEVMLINMAKTFLVTEPYEEASTHLVK